MSEDVAGRLAEALTLAQQQWPHCPVPDGLYEEEVRAIIEALLPVVDAIARERAAEELEAAANYCCRGDSAALSDRAAALRGGDGR